MTDRFLLFIEELSLLKTYAGCKMHKLNRDYFSLNPRTVLNKGKIVPINLMHFSECVGFFSGYLRFFQKVKEVHDL